MKIIAQSDPHADMRLYRDTMQHLEKNEYDVFLGLGDFIHQNYFANLARNINTEDKFFIPGNRDLALKKLPYLKEFNVEEIGEYTFVFAGSSTSLNYKRKILEACEDKDNSKVIICTHVPPKGIRDETTRGQHAGAPEFKELLDEIEPFIWFCGHIHEARGIEKYGETTVVNAAASQEILGYKVQIRKGEINAREIKR